MENNNKTNEDVVTITKDEYNKLKKDSDFLGCLVAAGVDNWEGYDYANEMFNGEDLS